MARRTTMSASRSIGEINRGRSHRNVVHRHTACQRRKSRQALAWELARGARWTGETEIEWRKNWKLELKKPKRTATAKARRGERSSGWRAGGEREGGDRNNRFGDHCGTFRMCSSRRGGYSIGRRRGSVRIRSAAMTSGPSNRRSRAAMETPTRSLASRGNAEAHLPSSLAEGTGLLPRSGIRRARILAG